MNSTGANYTPLECLLLFQSLVVYGNEDQDFERISTLLANNDLVRSAETYDAQRLSAEALRQLYLQLLRDELKAEEEVQDEQTSKKRKLPTPPLPSIKDAQEYKGKLPFLVDRLYARYREHTTKAIREDEERYEAIQKEIREIQRGEWDERILAERKASNGVAAEPKNGTQEGMAHGSRPESMKLPSNPNSPLPSPRPNPMAITNVSNNKDAAPKSPRMTDPARTQGYPPPPRPGSIGPHGPSPLQSYPPQPSSGFGQGQPQYQQPPMPPAGYASWDTLTQSSFQAPPNSQYNQYPPQNQSLPPHQPRPFSSPHGVPPPQPHVPSSPKQRPNQIILPPPNGTHRPPSSPAMPLDALSDAAGHRAHSGSPLMHPHGAPLMQYPHPHPHGSPMMQNSAQIYPGTPIMQGPPPGNQHAPHQRTPGNGPPFNPQYMPFQGPQNFQPPPNNRTPFQQPNSTPLQGKAYSSPYHAGDRKDSIPQTPFPRGLPRNSTGGGTVWTSSASAATPNTLLPFEAPKMESLSPVLVPAKLPEKEKTPQKAESAKAIQSVEQPKKSKTKVPRGSYRGRAGSTASSVLAGSHRSQSVMSHADELSLDNENINRVKQEVATPVGIDDTGDTTADELPPRHSRAEPSPAKSTKRKRAPSIPFPPIEVKPSNPPTQVLWTRAFPKISSSALESIAGHKNASTFSFPVKERDAPGYKNLILRPQDLKSIRSAILAGQRTAAALILEDPSLNTNPNASSIWLPISKDLIPPKGIINYAQLEKELMRMFANAIMFNADPDRGVGRRFTDNGGNNEDVLGYEFDVDGIVKDTRAMFADVEQVVGSLRSAERRSEERRSEETMEEGAVRGDDDDVDELAGDGESHVGNTGTAKRRRKG
ncbi:related to tpa inducible protein [Rhynchosporium agropyri]|uniref:Related to tpa inducible protein n=1 Tax=Rhynchosporium agropyri TaxID=914238 RepID=A0A1E1LQY7_9HELO|nr:related to tpa inducible protein [Rhynchosporium agropyri]